MKMFFKYENASSKIKYIFFIKYDLFLKIIL